MKTIAKMLWRRKVTVLALVMVLTVVMGGTAIAKPKLLKATLEYMNKTGFTGTVMKIVNNQGGSALELQSNDGKAPLIVKATDTNADGTPDGTPETATGLSADKLDGLDSTTFVRGISQHEGVSSTFDSTDVKSAHATCPDGKRVIGGGHIVTFGDPEPPIALVQSAPFSDGSGWYVQAREITTYDSWWEVRADAVCATVGS